MFQNYKTKTLKKDILSGIIVALVSIPISMGYAQVAGLPVVYGLYGSLLPILVFSLITSSPQFVFGVDATPAALVGATLASLGIVTGSEEAIRLVPVITLVTAGWLLLFYIVRAGKLVSYISTPGYGRIYFRYRLYDYFNAGGKAVWRFGRHGRTFCPDCPYLKPAAIF